MKKTGKNLKCKICNKSFYSPGWSIKIGAKFCSRQCLYVSRKGIHPIREFKKGNIPWNKGLKGIQLNTGKTHFQKGFTPWNKNKKCPNISGKNHWNWQNGKTPVAERLRKSAESQRWRRAVIKRDNAICQKCQIKNESIRLEVHHISSWFKYPQLRNNVTNGITLCQTCHIKEHFPKG